VVEGLAFAASALKLCDLFSGAGSATAGRNFAHVVPNLVADRGEFFNGAGERVIKDR
jgi:hypothetical protein